jgi:uncharacterized membrane protein
MTTGKPVTGRTRAVILFLDRGILWLSQHWLGLVNALAGLYVGLPVLAPVLMWLNLAAPARGIFFVYQYLCHQLPERSFFIFGNQIAFCQRDTAIYGSLFVAGLFYAASRWRWKPLKWWVFGLMLVPMVVDGSLQLLTPYESTWHLRVLTGVLTGAGGVWFLYPRLESAFNEIRREATDKLHRAALRDRQVR